MRTEVRENITDLIPDLRGFAGALTRSPDDADELVQTCLERALSREEQYQPGTNLKAWLFTILRNSHINEIRRRSRLNNAVQADEHEYLFPIRPSQETSVHCRDIARASGSLSGSDQKILALVGAEGMSYEEAAECIGIPTGTVRSRLSRARSRLRELVDAGRDEPVTIQ